MKRKPWPIIVLSLLHILAPVGNIIFNSYRAGRSFSQTWEFWFYSFPKPLFIAYIVLPPIAGIFIFICKRWSYWCYVGCLFLIFLANAYGFWTSMNWMNFLTLFAVLVVDILAVAYFVVPSVRKVYFDPRLRWWETAPRYLFNQQGVMYSMPGLIRNVSEGGAMFETNTAYAEGQEVELKWNYEGEEYSVPGKVVYKKTMGTGFCCGVRFDHTPMTLKAMKGLVLKLHKQGKMIRDRLPGPEDSFGAWLKKLVSTRQGLFPK